MRDTNNFASGWPPPAASPEAGRPKALGTSKQPLCGPFSSSERRNQNVARALRKKNGIVKEVRHQRCIAYVNQLVSLAGTFATRSAKCGTVSLEQPEDRTEELALARIGASRTSSPLTQRTIRSELATARDAVEGWILAVRTLTTYVSTVNGISFEMEHSKKSVIIILYNISLLSITGLCVNGGNTLGQQR